MASEPLPVRSVIARVPSGEITFDLGADGTYLRFDCDCNDALPYCKAACCSLTGIAVNREDPADLEDAELENGIDPDLVVWNATDETFEMKRSPSGCCCALNQHTRRCTIYNDRPATCREFHCTRGHGMRGWRLDLNRLD